MKITPLRSLAALVAACAFTAFTAFAADDEAGFVSVFNGKDLTGWAGPIDNYEVKDGAIVCKPGKGGTIYTKEEFADYVVRLEIKLPPGGNNGLAIRYPGSGDTAYVGMCEIQVLDDSSPKYKKLDPRQYNGALFLGLNGVVVKSHGGTDGEGFASAIAVAADIVKGDFNERIHTDLDIFDQDRKSTRLNSSH